MTRPDSPDAVVIGAGPAGSVAAFVLSSNGMRTLLVERRQFPRQKVCGGCLAPAGAARLRALGILDAGAKPGAPTPECLRVLSAGGSVRLPIKPYVGVDRREFDASLAQAACARGARLIQSARAEVLPGDRVRIERAGSVSVLRPGVVVVADGLMGSALRHRAEFRWAVEPGSPLGLGAVLDTPHADSDEITMCVGRAGYVGLAPIGGGRTAVGAAVSCEHVRRDGPAAVVRSVLSDAGLDDAPVAHASWRGVAQLTRRRWRFAGGRVLVVGDAARYVEPLTGEGMSWAILCASALAPFAQRVAAGEDCAPAWARHCRSVLRRRGLVCRAAVRLAQSPSARAAVSFLDARTSIPARLSRRACWGPA